MVERRPVAHVEPGEHDVQIYLEGHKVIREKVLFRPGATVRMVYTMQPLGPGEAAEPRPAPDERARERYDPGRQPARDYPREPATTDAGMLSLRVQPEDAIVLVDGEEWDRPAGESRFMIELPG